MRSVRQRLLAFPVRLSIRLSVRLMHANYTHTHTPSTHKLNFSVWQSAPVFRAIASPARERVAGRQAGGGSMQSAATTITIATSISWQQHTHTHTLMCGLRPAPCPQRRHSWSLFCFFGAGCLSSQYLLHSVPQSTVQRCKPTLKYSALLATAFSVALHWFACLTSLTVCAGAI